VARTLEETHRTRRLETHVAIALDDDDPALEKSLEAAQGWMRSDGDFVRTGPRRTMIAWTNEIALEMAGEYRYLATFGDDHVPRTRGFDRGLCGAIDDMGGTGFSYPWDGIREDIPEACVVSSDIVLALGWMMEPSMNHFYADNILGDLGKGAGCIRFLRGVNVEHLNAVTRPEVTDDVYRNNMRSFEHDKAAYETWRAERMEQDVAIVRELRERKLVSA
jgi:hypothetical protein